MADYSKSGFLYEAIKDAQGTIRALDFKANALLVTMALFVTNLSRFLDAVDASRTKRPELAWIVVGLALLGIVTWLVAVTSAFLALRSRVDPAHHISVKGCAKGTFYDASPGDVSVTRRVTELPGDEDAAVCELAYEHMKLAYIRGLKVHHTNGAFDFGFATLLILLAIWLFSVFSR